MIKKSDIFCILGAPDTEMNLIEYLLKKHKIPYTYAINRNGNRVNSRNAYKAEIQGVIIAKQVWLIECDVNDNNIWCENLIVIDHHNPRDFGYKIPPFDFLRASSIGQVLALLVRLGYHPFLPEIQIFQKKGIYHYKDGAWFLDDLPIPKKIALIAAADHCLASAYAGQCPGVNPVEISIFRAKKRINKEKKQVKKYFK